MATAIVVHCFGTKASVAATKAGTASPPTRTIKYGNDFITDGRTFALLYGSLN